MRAPRLPQAGAGLPPQYAGFPPQYAGLPAVFAGLPARVNALDEAATLAAGRSDDAAVAEAKRVCRQVDRRLAFSGDHTVVALAGATGSGKSSLFNAISGTQLARSGVHRPTTSAAMAACWGGDVGCTHLLNWLGVPDRHDVTRDAFPGGDAFAGSDAFPGLVLLDLPDHDSTDVSHRVEVDRLVQLVDAVIWVLDPQKYADAAVHERYLRPMADYADVMIVVLNQADRLAPPDLAVALADLRLRLAEDGLGKATVLATSALTGQGVDDLRARLAQLVGAKQAAAARLETDVTHAAKAMLGDVSRHRRRTIPAEASAGLQDALERAAAVPQVVAAVGQATRQRGAEATGWPVVSWVNRLKLDPLRRLRVASTATGVRVPGMDGAVAKAQVDAALRALGAGASAGLAPGWAAAVRQAAGDHRDELPRAIDEAVSSVDLGTGHTPRWWRVVRIVQWVLIGVVAAGLAWVLLGGVLPLPSWHGIGYPVFLIVGGVVVALLVALVSHAVVAAAARRQALQVGDALHGAVAAVADELVLAPVAAELDRFAGFVAAVARAL